LVIPLILVGPGIPQGKRVKQPVSIIDLMPTMLGLAKLVSPSGTAGMDLNGVWERPAGNDRDRYAFADRSVVVTLHAPRKHRNPLSVCWVRAHWKVIYDFQYDYHRYYDLSADPGELRGLRDWPGDPASLPSRTLLTWFEALPKYRPETGEKPELSHEDLAKLKSLGY
jgi:arylsulfatase A-like enzyme